MAWIPKRRNRICGARAAGCRMPIFRWIIGCSSFFARPIVWWWLANGFYSSCFLRGQSSWKKITEVFAGKHRFYYGWNRHVCRFKSPFSHDFPMMFPCFPVVFPCLFPLSPPLIFSSVVASPRLGSRPISWPGRWGPESVQLPFFR